MPNFVFNNNIVLILYKTITSSDSATFSEFNVIEEIELKIAVDSFVVAEKIELFISNIAIDSFVVAEKIISYADINLFDSATVTDQFDSITFEQFDSSAFVESIGLLSVDGPHEHIYFEETVNNFALESMDSGSAQDVAEVGVFIEDSITLSDFVNNIAFAQTDAAQATDALIAISAFVSAFDLDQTYLEFSGFITADGPGLDHIHWDDDFDYQFIATLSTVDDPIVSENISNIEISLLESLTVSESISLSLIGNDNLALVDTLGFLTIFVASQDEFIYQELFELTTNTNVSEVIAATDASLLTVDVVGNENIALDELISITISIADSGNLTEIVANAFAESDSLNFVENRNISLTQSDLALLTDFSNINVNVTTTDLTNLTERNNFINLIGNETSQLIETLFYQVDYSRLDYLSLISEISIPSLLREVEDSFAVTELKNNIILDIFQLITFKERIGIGKAAPLIININNNPTIHGSVTGDIINISIGGTEPVLL